MFYFVKCLFSSREEFTRKNKRSDYIPTHISAKIYFPDVVFSRLHDHFKLRQFFLRS